MPNTMDADRWNLFINFVNNGKPMSELDPPIQNEDEERIFKNMETKLQEIRKIRPQAAFYPVEKETKE